MDDDSNSQLQPEEIYEGTIGKKTTITDFLDQLNEYSEVFSNDKLTQDKFVTSLKLNERLGAMSKQLTNNYLSPQTDDDGTEMFYIAGLLRHDLIKHTFANFSLTLSFLEISDEDPNNINNQNLWKKAVAEYNALKSFLVSFRSFVETGDTVQFNDAIESIPKYGEYAETLTSEFEDIRVTPPISLEGNAALDYGFQNFTQFIIIRTLLLNSAASDSSRIIFSANSQNQTKFIFRVYDDATEGDWETNIVNSTEKKFKEGIEEKGSPGGESEGGLRLTGKLLGKLFGKKDEEGTNLDKVLRFGTEEREGRKMKYIEITVPIKIEAFS